MRQLSSATWWLAALCAGCTTLAGIDDDYVAKKADVGGTGAAGSAGSAGEGGTGGFGGLGGAVGSGGVSGSTAGSSGAAGSGGSAGAQGDAGSAGSGGTGMTSGSGGTGPSCSGTQKACGAECVTPGPENGCMSVSCDACPTSSVEHAFAVCLGGNCGLQCEDGYVPDGGRCVPAGSGGTSGSGGTAGSAGTGGTGGASGSGGSGGTGGSGGSGGSGGGTCYPPRCPPCDDLDGKIPCCRNGICACGYPFTCF